MEEKTLGLLPIRFQNYGVNFAATYIGEVLGNASGGSKQGTIYEGRLNLAVDVDLQKLVGIDKLTFHANIPWRRVVALQFRRNEHPAASVISHQCCQKEETMETERRETGTLIGSDKVEGTAVYDNQKIGSVERVMIDKVSGQVSYAVLSFGGFLGIGDDHYPLPWQSLKYDTGLGGYRTKLHSTNPIERLNGEIKRRTEVVGIFPNEDAIVRLIGAILLEQNDEWAVQRARYMTLEQSRR